MALRVKRIVAWVSVALLLLFPISRPVARWFRSDPGPPADRALSLQLSRVQYGIMPAVRCVFLLYQSQPTAGGSLSIHTSPGSYTPTSMHYEPVYLAYLCQLVLAAFLSYRAFCFLRPTDARATGEPKLHLFPTITAVVAASVCLNQVVLFLLLIASRGAAGYTLINLVILGYISSWLCIAIGFIVALTSPVNWIQWLCIAVYVGTMAVNLVLTAAAHVPVFL